MVRRHHRKSLWQRGIKEKIWIFGKGGPKGIFLVRGDQSKIFKIFKFVLKANQRQKFKIYGKAAPQKKSVAKGD